jgi:hypothetical protein
MPTEAWSTLIYSLFLPSHLFALSLPHRLVAVAVKNRHALAEAPGVHTLYAIMARASIFKTGQ